MKKTMQKKLIVLLLVLAILTSLVLCGCGDKKVSKRVTIYLVDADRSAVECTAVTTGDNLADLLVEKQNELGIEYEDSAYGMYITSIRGWECPQIPSFPFSQASGRSKAATRFIPTLRRSIIFITFV